MFLSLYFCFIPAIVAECPPGLIEVLSANHRPITCSPQDVCSCDNESPGSVCQYSLQLKHYICCTGQAPRDYPLNLGATKLRFLGPSLTGCKTVLTMGIE
ncbi:multiple EGF-like-domains-containing protein [Parelaphostrongylus tenuis]|uniref:Multiple EGF-like-domains-containing protein n=1 Tax=Parelaphostrongylus tenuis TaxID=148309 RepID=A0AAD5MEM0_PARTN|nr:multiple EGF-like-domains-containing protein [Parelaphostrongylus tenuis]